MSGGDSLRLGASTGPPRRAVWAALALVLAGCAAAPTLSPRADLPSNGVFVVVAGEPLVGLGVSTDSRLFVLTASGVSLVENAECCQGNELWTFLSGETTGHDLIAPTDFDPTNGQDLYIADGSRVLRFSDEGRLVQTLDIPAVDRPQPTTGPTAPPGEAVAVAAGVEGRLFVAESTRGVVQVWRDGALEDVIGGLGRPVSLASAGRRLYVADAEAGVVRVLDSEGRPLLVLRDEALANVISVSLAGETVIVLGPEAVVLFSSGGAHPRVIPISGGARLLDAAVLGDRLFVLTPDAVHSLGRLD